MARTEKDYAVDLTKNERSRKSTGRGMEGAAWEVPAEIVCLLREPPRGKQHSCKNYR